MTAKLQQIFGINKKSPADFANYANYYPYRIKNSIICKLRDQLIKSTIHSDVCFCLIVSFDEFETPAGVMVRTFPETSLIILLVHRTIFQYSPVPLTVLGVQEMLGYIVPAGDGNQKILFGAEILVEDDMADDVLALHPPLALEIILISIFPMLVNHTAIRT